MTPRRPPRAAAAILAAATLASCAGGGRDVPSGTVLEVARANGLDGFARAAERAGLADTLAGPGPYTVFAPSDRALAGLPRDPQALGRVVAYHVVPGSFDTGFFVGLDVNYTTLEGSSVNVDGTGGSILVNGARVVTPDLDTGNGVVHVIDRVLDPD